MAETVYVLCSLTSLVCAMLLFRGYSRSRTLLSLCASLCFFGLALNNTLLFIDLVILPHAISLIFLRGLFAISAFSVMIYGCVWEAR